MPKPRRRVSGIGSPGTGASDQGRPEPSRVQGEKGSNPPKAENGLRDSEVLLHLLVEGARDYALFILDPEGRISTWNIGAEALKGYRAEEVLGRHFSIFYPAEAVARGWPERELQVASETGRFEDEGWRIRKDGSRFWANVILTALHDSHGTLRGFSKLTRDLSERKRAEEALLEAYAELEIRVEQRTAELARANEALRGANIRLSLANRDLESFASSVSHDLRAPLRAILAFATLLQERHREELGSEARRLLTVIGANAEIMNQLINSLLQLSRIARRPLKRVPVDMTALAQSIFSQLQASEPGRTVDLALQPLAPAHGDETLLGQVFANLIGNAMKFTARCPNPRIEIGCERDGSKTVYYVRDNGVGFDMQYAHRLFGVFERLHSAEEFEGTGIGLATVKRIVQHHGGRIWAEGRVNHGATFRFDLPHAAEPDRLSTAGKQDAPPLQDE